MLHKMTLRRVAQSIGASLVLLTAAVAAYGMDTYVPATGTLTIPVLGVGHATYANVVVKVGKIVAAPSGTAPNAIRDSYNPANNQLTVPAVTVGANTYYNAVVTVGQLVSIGTVTGADTFDGIHLYVPALQVGTQVYTNVVLNVDLRNVVRIDGGMPSAALDQYDPATGRLTLPAVQRRADVFTNLVLTAGKSNIVSIGASGPDVYANATYTGSSYLQNAVQTITVHTTTVGRLTANINGDTSPGLSGQYAAATGAFFATGAWQGQPVELTGVLNPPPSTDAGGQFTLNVNGTIGTGLFGNLVANTSYFTNVTAKVQGNLSPAGVSWASVGANLVASNPPPPGFKTGMFLASLEDPPGYFPSMTIWGNAIVPGQTTFPIAQPTPEFIEGNYGPNGVVFDAVPAGQVIIVFYPDTAHTYYATAGTMFATTLNAANNQIVFHLFNVFFQGQADLDPSLTIAGNQGSFDMDLTAIGTYSTN